MIRRPPRSTQSRSSAASDVYKRQGWEAHVRSQASDDRQRWEAAILQIERQQPLALSLAAGHKWNNKTLALLGVIQEVLPFLQEPHNVVRDNTHHGEGQPVEVDNTPDDGTVRRELVAPQSL